MMNECFLPTSADRQYVPSFKCLQDQLKFVRVVVHGHWLIKTDVLLSRSRSSHTGIAQRRKEEEERGRVTEK